MAEKKYNVKQRIFTAEDILQKIYVQATFHNESGSKDKDFFISEGLKPVGDYLTELISEKEELGSNEWQKLELSQSLDSENNIINLGTLPQDVDKFKKHLQLLEQYYLMHSMLKSYEVLGAMVLHGQELLRRKYLAKLLSPDRMIKLSENCEKIIEAGASAIQRLGKVPRLPYRSFRKFNSSQVPKPKDTGIEILSSGSFPDWTDPVNLSLRESGKVKTSGFENVIEAVLDTPRTRAIAKVIKKKKISPLLLPAFLRMTLDLELMRLGQATTPGTFKMLLNSYYYGAGIVDHSTNVSEQVQIIYEEENWKAAFIIEKEKSPTKQAQEAAKSLVTEYFRYKNESSVSRDHLRTARIEFPDDMDSKIITTFFKELFEIVDNGKKISGVSYKRNKKLNRLIPTVRLSNYIDRDKIVKDCVDLMKSIGFKEIYITSDYIRHSPGLLQYFKDENETNSIIKYTKDRKVKLLDGRTVDMIATSNKTIEAAAGAIMSGQGCIKVGLLGLTYEQMYDFIKMVKDGLDAKAKRQGNQLLVFIGLIDEPIVSVDRVYTDAFEISEKFIELMKRRRHDMLLLDTMHKGKEDKRYVSEKSINPKDKKGGHLTFAQSKQLIKKANDGACELWVAGSYTEEQVYQASLEPIKYRPGLICLGGAERSFGGIRLDPRDAYEATGNNSDEKSLSALVQMDSDVRFTLSRENKLARDSGHIEGELRRRGRKEAKTLKNMRKKYLKIRNSYFNSLSETALKYKVLRKNIDLFIENQNEIFSHIPKKDFAELNKSKQEYLEFRKKYVDVIEKHMHDLFSKAWFTY